jgi:hypothetical protein
MQNPVNLLFLRCGDRRHRLFMSVNDKPQLLLELRKLFIGVGVKPFLHLRKCHHDQIPRQADKPAGSSDLKPRLKRCHIRFANHVVAFYRRRNNLGRVTVPGRQTPFSQIIGTADIGTDTGTGFLSTNVDKPESCGNGSGWAFTGSARIDLNDAKPNVRSLTTLIRDSPRPNI